MAAPKQTVSREEEIKGGAVKFGAYVCGIAEAAAFEEGCGDPALGLGESAGADE